ncbi:putative aldo-keto reductase [Microthyrium microscopicum]|uniref:Putative aldo-keto reductase n=1 Tax=Microthyrium microscopicum TaxID=703497 RepID=A0A6A6UQ10_9PEZI|nr:putative aldo-keto reductase [Microthyrium microscopicum]
MMSPSYPTRKLGKNGPQVTSIGWGAMGLSAFYGTIKPDNERLALLDQLYDLGQRNWDSADMYGDSEDLLGKWFKANPDKRANIFLATKFANGRSENGDRWVNSSPEYAKQACAKSLKRLNVDYIDLYYCHRQDPKVPIEQTVRAMAELQKEGKIKYIGLSECSATSLRRACKIAHIDAVQLEYSPFSLDIEKPEIDLLKTARELGVAVVAYSPLGRGMIGTKARSTDDFPDDDFRKGLPRFQGENFKKNIELSDKFVSMAKSKGCTATQLALAWLLAQDDNVIPIPGSTNLERIKENMGALEVKLTKEELSEIRKASEASEPAGTRYPEAMMGYSFVDTVEE